MAGDTGTQLRNHVRGLAKTYNCQATMGVRSEGRGKWRVYWTDGPSVTRVSRSIARDLPDLTGIRFDRDHERRPMLLGALRVVATATEERMERLTDRVWGDLESAAREHLDDVTDPWESATARERAMVERLLAHTARRDPWGDTFEDEDAALAELLRRRGVTWLLEPAADTTVPGPVRQAEPDATADALALTPLELLTARYAAGGDRRAWDQGAQPTPAGHLFAQAVGDAGIGKAEALAALSLAAGVRAEADAGEARLIDAARAAGASWTEVGGILGMTKQSAAERRARLTPSASA
ncbi:hypothetical protein ACFVXG_38150 [Kitasatospora sp. NPDC058162]|uniref:hypothetical protein n=1 Tax=Kitasatospora sp. NPDC058162 TaxID=3346362 RepID=UPI0036DAC881